MEIGFRISDPGEHDLAGADKGFEIIRIEAIMGTAVVGYMKISLLSQENFNKQIPSIWHYLKLWKGFVKIDLSAYDSEDVDGLFDSVLGYRGMPPYDAQSWTQKEKLASLSRIEAEFEDSMKEELLALIDSPYVDYIEVLDEKRRQGIASALYREADRYMNLRGYKFRSPKSRSDDAEATWERLVQKGLAIKTENGFYELL